MEIAFSTTNYQKDFSNYRVNETSKWGILQFTQIQECTPTHSWGSWNKMLHIYQLRYTCYTTAIAWHSNSRILKNPCYSFDFFQVKEQCCVWTLTFYGQWKTSKKLNNIGHENSNKIWRIFIKIFKCEFKAQKLSRHSGILSLFKAKANIIDIGPLLSNSESVLMHLWPHSKQKLKIVFTIGW